METRVLSFTGPALRKAAGGVAIHVPFDPAEAWGLRDSYHVTGTIDDVGFRTTLVRRGGEWRIALGPKSSSGARLHDGQTVSVEMWPEGPQAQQLAPDVAAALAARPRARVAFDGLATFYRKGWLRWIDATRRRPEVRAARIAEMARLVEERQKDHP
jgi:hypothetical protein